MLKKIIACLVFVFLMSVVSFAEQAPVVIVNNTLKQLENIEITPDDHVMVWLRDLEKLGWGNISVGSAGETVFSNDKVTLAFNKNSESAKFNSLSVKLPVKTYLRDGKFMVPISFVAKAMGYEYSAEERVIVFIKQPDAPAEVPAQPKVTAPASPANTVPKATVTPKVPQKTDTAAKPADNTASGGNAASADSKPTANSNSNWFQGTVVHNDKKIGGVKLALTDANNKFIKTAVSDAGGSFTFYSLPNGTYNIVINNSDNPEYKTDKIANLAISGGAAKKLDKPIQLVGAMKLKSSPKLSSDKNYNLAWNKIPGAVQYKISLASSNSKALKPSFTTKTENISIPLDKLSKGQNYSVSVTAVNTKGAVIGESNGKEWAITTP